MGTIKATFWDSVVPNGHHQFFAMSRAKMAGRSKYGAYYERRAIKIDALLKALQTQTKKGN
jgi:hypothetical protein